MKHNTCSVWTVKILIINYKYNTFDILVRIYGIYISMMNYKFWEIKSFTHLLHIPKKML